MPGHNVRLAGQLVGGLMRDRYDVVIIGAGNVGCDAAAEAHRFGGKVITLLDVQEPASFGKEREAAVAVGATFKWPVFTKEITSKSV